MNKLFISAFLIISFTLSACGGSEELLMTAKAANTPGSGYISPAGTMVDYFLTPAEQAGVNAGIAKAAAAKRAGAAATLGIVGLAVGALFTSSDSSPDDPNSDVALANADAKCRANPECLRRMNK